MTALNILNAQQTALQGAWLLLARRLAARGQIEAGGLVDDMQLLAAVLPCSEARAVLAEMAEMLKRAIPVSKAADAIP